MINQLAQHANSKQTPDLDAFITVVSGLPRSGTSMMMGMLAAGGLPLMVDSIRQPDESNPKGYYEFEPVKQMQRSDNAWMVECRGKAVKIISPLLQFMPQDHAYRVIFMKRNIAEILASQRAMLGRQGETSRKVDDQEMEAIYQKHLDVITTWLAAQDNIQVLYLNYNQIILNPAPTIAQLTQFIHPLKLDSAKIQAAIEVSLYRQRRSSQGQP